MESIIYVVAIGFSFSLILIPIVTFIRHLIQTIFLTE